MNDLRKPILVCLFLLGCAFCIGSPMLLSEDPETPMRSESPTPLPDRSTIDEPSSLFDSPGSYVPPPSEGGLHDFFDNKLDSTPLSGLVQLSSSTQGPLVCCQCERRILPEQEYYDLTGIACSECDGRVVDDGFCNTTCCKYGDTYFLKPEGSCSGDYVVERTRCDHEIQQICCQTRDTPSLEWTQRQFCDPRYALEVDDQLCEEAYRNICCETGTDEAQSTTAQHCTTLNGREVETATCADLESLVCCSYSRDDMADTSAIMQKQDCFKKEGYIESSNDSCDWLSTYMCCETLHNYSSFMFRGECIDEGGTPTNSERCSEIHCCSLGDGRYNRYTSETCILRQHGTIVDEGHCEQASERICCKLDERYIYVNRQRCRGEERPDQECRDHNAPDYWSIYF